MEHQSSGLRSPRTSLIGREAELDALDAALLASRLVTVTGAGGAGKTRLAVEVAAHAGSRFPDGTYSAGLAPVGTAEGIVGTILSTLDPSARPPPDPEPVARLTRAIGTRRLLLVLDDCEHALDVIASIADRLLDTCDEVRLLATSREPLRIPGESVIAVDPLTVRPCSLERPSAAVRLFLDRARAVRHDLRLTTDNLADMVSICERVDGLPLAIELAAAHVGHLSTAEIGRRLEERPDSLAARDRTTAARHRTLTATLDWSYRLLSPPEQRVLRRTAVFVDGAPAAGIAAVTDVDEELAREVLGSLVDKNLVRVDEHDGVSRYRLLGTVRHYALARLEAAGEVAAARRREARWLAGSGTEELAPGDRWTCGGAEGLADLTDTLGWALDAGETELAVMLAGGSWRAWEVTGRHAEGRRLLAAVLAAIGSRSSPDTARVRLASAQLAFVAGDLAAARGEYERTIETLRELGGDAELAAALHGLAMVHLFDGAIDAARDLAHEALERFRRLDDDSGAAFAHTSLGMIEAHGGHPERAERHYLEALAGCRQRGLRREAASVLDNLGNLAADLGRASRAHRFYEGALQLQEQIGDDRGAALSLNGLCLVAQRRGNLDRAWEYAEAARQRFQRIGDRTGEAATINNLANLAYERGQAPQAMELYSECIRAFREMGDARRLATALANLADLACGVEERQLAWNCLIDATSLWVELDDTAGMRAGLAQLGELARAWGVTDVPALEDADSGAAVTPDGTSDRAVVVRTLEAARWVSVPPPPAERRRDDGPLTAREWQVVDLVARGLTNAEIARELFISERTVESHVSNARGKLAIDSRTKLTRWVLEHDRAPRG